ncbi:hypothetical protein MASR2M15_03740 [Anaerolineales bacterium]
MSQHKETSTRFHPLILIAVGIFLVLILLAIWLFMAILKGDLPGELESVWLTQTPALQELNQETISLLRERLAEVGLAEGPYADAIGIQAHIARLQDEQISIDRLWIYSNDLEILNQMTKAHGTQIPTRFWDVEDSGMSEVNLSPYELVNLLVQADQQGFVALYAQAYDRFYSFQTDRSHQDTAVDTSLDILLYVMDYVDQLYADQAPLTQEAFTDEKLKQTLRLWQSLIVGSDYTNPLTGQALMTAPLSSRLNVVEMWRYEIEDIQLKTEDAWGVSGFAARFVGDPANTDQIEQLSLSSFLQIVLNEPLLVLNSDDIFQLLNGHLKDSDSGQADLALNAAIHHQFAPRLRENPHTAVAYMRCYLKSEAEEGCQEEE